jgi:hypothetical protein
MVVFKVGIGGNNYVFSKEKTPVEDIARSIGKAISSVYFNKKYQVYAIRCKNETHKQKLKEMFSTENKL